MSPDHRQRQQIEDTTAARLAEIVAAAERAAKQVIDEAEAEARERLSDASEEADRIVAERLGKLTMLTGELDLQAEALSLGAEALRAALAEARAELGGGESFGGSAATRRAEPTPAPAPDPEDERPKSPALKVVGGVAPAPVAPPQVAPEPPVESDPDPEPLGTAAGARLLATQMAVSGSSREEIETRLRSGFAIADTAAILDAILGPER
jgi:vacuolar-type H+-ATPase subunit H